MFKKISVIAAGLLAVVLVGGASLTSAGASGTDDGPCVIATLVDDPSVTAQRGNCPEPTPEPTVEEPAGEQVVHHFISRIRFVEMNEDGGPVRATLVNQVTGKTVFDETQQWTWETSKEFQMYDHFVHAASDPVPTYRLTLTFGGKTYIHESKASQFYDVGDWDGLQGYVAEDYMRFENGAILEGIV